MIYIDKVYEKSIDINDQVLIDLINSKVVQRLKNVNQLGVPGRWQHGYEFYRYEHSMGVLFLCYKFNLSLEYKIAGLLHDVAHTAFSHVYDYLIENYDENFHDNYIGEYLVKTKEIITILEKYNINYKKIIDLETNFPIIKNKTRLLNLDRLDYTLREFYYFKKDLNVVRDILNNISVSNNNLILSNKLYAQKIYDIYDYFTNNHWGGKKHKSTYYEFTKILKRAIELKLIFYDDFYKTDKYILDILFNSKDLKIKEGIYKLENKQIELLDIKTKKRNLNVLYKENGIIKQI
jgi:hypothetical protein